MASHNQKTNLDIKKTLLLTLDFPPQKGGVANYLSNFSKNLPADKIVILTNHHAQSESFDNQQDYKIIRKNLYYKNFWPHWLKTYFIAKKLIKQQKIQQIIISHVLPMGYINLLLNKPFYVILHGYDILLAQKSFWKKLWLKIILHQARHIIVNSNFTKSKVLKQGIKPKKITIVYPCPNIKPTDLNSNKKQIIKKELDLENKKILLSVGRLTKRKGHDKVIECLPDLIAQIPNLIYLLVGEGDYKKELEELAEKLQVRGNLIFLENISDTNLPYYYDLADVFIMPSRLENKTDVEGFGIVYLEANLFQKPVIAGQSGGVSDAVINNQTGFLVDPQNCTEIKQTITKLFNNQKLMNKLGVQGKERVRAKFQWPIQIAKLKNIL
jgi:phosphatidylinositol alpha-1,6-mannosyltransferase